MLYNFTYTIHNLCIFFIYYLCNYTSCCTFYYLFIYLVQPLYYFILMNKYRRATMWNNKPLLLLLLLLLLLFCLINHLKRRHLWDNNNWLAAVTLKHATILRDFLEVPLLEKILSLKSRESPFFLHCRALGKLALFSHHSRSRRAPGCLLILPRVCHWLLVIFPLL